MPARITRSSQAPEYVALRHSGVAATRLQGHEAGATERFWVGRSVYSPGSGAELWPTSEETVYVVEEGSLRLTVDGTAQDLFAGDSVHMPKGTVRQVDNITDADARMLVIVAVPPATDS